MGRYNSGLEIMYYRLNFDYSKTYKIIFRKVLLVIAIVLDIFGIFFIIDAIMSDNLYIIAVLGCFLTSLSARILSIRLYFSIDIILESNRLKIVKKYPYGEKIIFDTDIGEIISINLVSRLTENNKKFYLSDCNLPYYTINCVGDKSISIYLDDFLFSYLDNNTGAKNDLF